MLIELLDKSFTPVHDHNGSVAVLVDNYSGTVKESYRYSAYGEEEIFNSSAKRIDHSSISNPWRYGNKRIDEASGLINFGMRYFDPSIGQWLTQDPAGFVDGPNLYAYCYNSPLLFYDPYGLSPLDTAYGLGIGVGNTAYGIASGTVNLGLSLLNSIAHPIDTAETALEFTSQCKQIIDERGFEQIKNDLSMEISDSISRYGQRWQNANDKECGIMMGEVGSEIASFLVPMGLAAKAKWASRSANTIRKAATVIKHESKVHKAATISSQAENKLNRFHQAASQLSEEAQNNIRILRGWAKSKGWVKFSEDGKPEAWGVFNPIRNTYDWRLKIKAEGSFREGLTRGSNVPRFDAKLDKGKYINPLTNERGNSKIGTHVSLDITW